MRKLIVIITIFSLIFIVPTVITAQSDKAQGKGIIKKNTKVQNSYETGDDESEETLTPSELAKQKTAAKKLLKITDITEDAEIEEEIEDLAEEQEQAEAEAEETIEVIDQRPAAVKFLIGPDYKNLGQLRSNIVRVRNNIRQLERVRERAGETEQAAIEEALSEMKETASGLQAQMYEQLSDFSLFGWLFRWLSGFTPPEDETIPAETVTPTISETPTLTPTPTDVEPTATPVEEEGSPTPTESILPTETAYPTETPTI